MIDRHDHPIQWGREWGGGGGMVGRIALLVGPSCYSATECRVSCCGEVSSCIVMLLPCYHTVTIVNVLLS